MNKKTATLAVFLYSLLYLMVSFPFSDIFIYNIILENFFMKNLVALHEPEMLFEYVGRIWRSPIFQASHQDSNGYIHRLIRQFSEQPRVFFDMHLERLEMVHFTSWMQAIQHRYHYTHDVLHDLYYHHEFYHLITTDYNPHVSWQAWYHKMDTIEFWASLESEVLIYFYLPELRPYSFKNELWVDSYLERKELQVLKGAYIKKTQASEKARLYIASERKRCETEPRNTIEQMISQYTVSSLKWAQIWKNSWREVEEHVCQFIAFKDKEKALNMHLSWLTEKQAQSKSGVIFEQEAQAYSEVHQTMFTSAYQPIN